MAASTILGAINDAGNGLVARQATNGSWAGEEDFTGSIVSGLLNAYQVTGNPIYKDAAEKGGTYIQAHPINGAYSGDAMYALSQLSEISADPASNSWRTTIASFYQAVRDSSGGTPGYVSAFAGAEPSTAVFYIAQHAAAASYVNAVDKGIWRSGVVNSLTTVQDYTANYPVMGLGVATWSLAQTGPMDNTLVDPSATTGYWKSVRLSDLPSLLVGNQVTSGDNADSFFWRFDHTDGGSGGESSGYTEDAVYGVLGMLAANQANPSLSLSSQIQAARLDLAGAVGLDGTVYEQIWLGGASYNVYAGEVLQALPEPATLVLLAAGGLAALCRRPRREETNKPCR